MVQVQRLTSIGISPSSDWLEACLQYLQQQNQTIDEDAILEQILNMDLRDVVRCISVGGGGQDEPPTSDSPGILLRDSIIESNKSRKSTLPDSFRCIVQIEELLDVSMNAEQRLTLGPTSSSSPTPIGNQNNRCLKMYISDGYHNDGGRSEGTSTSLSSPMHIVAMETEPIPSLSVHSKPGIKVILSGPIVIRFGILMLDQSNTTVLGGCIPELIPIQKKAMELAAKRAGVGIDPTFKALVWNPETGMEDDEDEGEGESGDIQSRDISMPINPPSLPPVEAVVRNPIRNRTTESERISGSGSNSLPNTASGTARTPLTSTSTASSAITRGHVANPYSKRQNVPSSSNSTNTRTVSTPLNYQTPTSLSTSIRNPYNKSHTSSGLNAHSYSAQQTDRSSENGARKTPLHATSTFIDLTSSDEINQEGAEIENIIPDGNGLSDVTRMNIDRLTPTPNPRPSSSTLTTAFQNLSPTALSEPLSFSELRMVLKNIVLDHDEYKRYEKRTFIVPCRVSNKKDDFKGFTIDKNKNYKKKSKAGKYGYTMICQMTGQNESQEKITCKLINDIVAPFFSISASDIRKLLKEDKKKGNKIANEGGTSALADLSKLSKCYLRLTYSCEDFFRLSREKKIDVAGDDAILELYAREEL